MTNYAGIDYSGPGSTINRDSETGIRYGIISQNSLGDFAIDNVYSNGEDVGFLAAKEEMIDALKGAILRAMEDYGRMDDGTARDWAEHIADGDGFEWSDCDESGPYELEADGYQLRTTSDNNLWVIKSDFYTHAQFCSPCVPGAGNLDTHCPSGPKTYCLGHDWFDDKAPYPVYRVSDDSLVE